MLSRVIFAALAFSGCTLRMQSIDPGMATTASKHETILPVSEFMVGTVLKDLHKGANDFFSKFVNGKKLGYSENLMNDLVFGLDGNVKPAILEEIGEMGKRPKFIEPYFENVPSFDGTQELPHWTKAEDDARSLADGIRKMVPEGVPGDFDTKSDLGFSDLLTAAKKLPRLDRNSALAGSFVEKSAPEAPTNSLIHPSWWAANWAKPTFNFPMPGTSGGDYLENQYMPAGALKSQVLAPDWWKKNQVANPLKPWMKTLDLSPPPDGMDKAEDLYTEYKNNVKKDPVVDWYRKTYDKGKDGVLDPFGVWPTAAEIKNNKKTNSNF